MEQRDDPKKGKGMTPEEAARAVEPRSASRSAGADDDPREELGDGQPESSARKTTEPE